MLFNVAIHHQGTHLIVVASGRAQLCDVCGLVDLAARVAAMKNYRRVLVDLLATEPELTFTEHLQAGAHVAQAMANLDRVATVVSEKYRSGTSERAAQRHGLNLRAFTDIHSAEAWLAQASGDPA